MKYIYYILVLIVLLYSCERRDQNTDCEYSIEPFVVDKTCNFTELNDTLFIIGGRDSTELKLSGNSSVRFVYYYARFMASSVEAFDWKIKPIGYCELLLDTSLQMKKVYPDTFYIHIPMPFILNLNDTINTSGNWSNSELTFTRNKAEIYWDGYTKVRHHYIPGWNNLGEKFFAFREFHDSDTIYGIFKIDVHSYVTYIKGWGTY